MLSLGVPPFRRTDRSQGDDRALNNNVYLNQCSGFNRPERGLRVHTAATVLQLPSDTSILRERLLYHIAHGARDFEIQMLTRDDVVIDTDQIAALKEYPPETWPMFAKAIADEMGGLLDLDTFTVAMLPPGRETIGCKMVLKIKKKADGSLDKYKARNVIQGFHQRMGKDFFSTFAPMASTTSVRTVLAIATHLKMDLAQLDVPQAFVQGNVDTEIFVKLPKGISILTIDEYGNRVTLEKAGKVLQLLKSLYGLKQAGQIWNKELTEYLESIGFTRCASESSVFCKRGDDGLFTIVLTEVDDLIITSTQTMGMDDIEKSFKDKWNVKDWGPLESYLGMRIVYDKEAGILSVDVENKVNELFEKHQNAFGKVGSSNVPYVDAQVKNARDQPNRQLSSYEQYLQKQFASIVGSFIFISITARPDIVYAVNQMAKGMHKPEIHHIVVMKQTLRYLNSHRPLRLTYRRRNNLINGLFRTLGGMDGALQTMFSTADTPGDPVVLFSDADYANDPDTRKSISGQATYLFGCLINWRSKRQPVIAGSTHEAEIVAIALCADEGIWQRRLLEELGIFGTAELYGTKDRMPPTPLLSDNKASTFTANNPTTGIRSKHIDVRFLKVREYIASGELRVVHVRTEYNVSDFFTKGLTIQKYSNFRDLLMGEQISKTKPLIPPPIFGGG